MSGLLWEQKSEEGRFAALEQNERRVTGGEVRGDGVEGNRPGRVLVGCYKEFGFYST